jgi:hypothetical protein
LIIAVSIALADTVFKLDATEQLSDPLRIPDITFAAGHRLHVGSSAAATPP